MRYLLLLALVLSGCAQQPVAAHDDELPTKNGFVSQKQIFTGCALKAELTFYAAQERLYNNGNAQKMLDYLQQNMAEAEFRLARKGMKQLGEWVDTNDYDTAKEYGRTMMYECVKNSYEYFQMQPTEDAAIYIQRFEQLLETVGEKLFPYELDGAEIEARLDMRDVLPWWMQ